MKIILSLLIVYFSFSGSGTAYLKCKSASGKTSFTAELQDIVGLLEGAKFSIDDHTLEFKDPDEVFTIIDPSNGVFTIYIQGKPDKQYTNHRYVQFWAIPSTFKIIRNERHHKIYEFKAKIYGTEPRPDKEMHSPEIELDCRLEYKV